MQNTLEIFKMLSKEHKIFGNTNRPHKVLFEVLKMLAIILFASACLIAVFFSFYLVGFVVNRTFFAVMLLFTQILSITLALGSIIKNMYRAKDNELLFTLPCTSSEIFWGKLLTLFVSELKSNIMFSVPVFLSYGLIGLFVNVTEPISMWFFILMPLFIVLLTVFCLIVAGFLSVPVVALINYLNARPILKVVVYGIVIGTVLITYIVAVLQMTGTINFNGQRYQIVQSIYELLYNVAYYSFIFNFIANIILIGNGFIWQLPVILISMAAIGYFAILIIKKYFFYLATKSNDKPATMPSLRKVHKPKGILRSLIHKESVELFRSADNLLQFFVFTICMPFVVLVYDRMLTGLNVNQTGQVLIFGSHVLILVLFACLSNLSSASAISRDGQNSYWGKVTPVGFKSFALSKLILNFGFTTLAVVVTSVVVALFTTLNPMYNLIACISTIIISLGHLLFSFYLDLKNPVTTWLDESEIPKKSKSTMYSTIASLVISVIAFVVVLLFSIYISELVAFIALVCLGVVMVSVMTPLLLTNGKKLFGKVGA